MDMERDDYVDAWVAADLEVEEQGVIFDDATEL